MSSNKKAGKRKKTASKPASSKRKTAAKSTARAKTKAKPKESVIVRIMGQGQFVVDRSIVQKLNEIDNSIVKLIENKPDSENENDNSDFRKRLTQLVGLVTEKGNPLDPKEIVESDIILPSDDISMDEAKLLFSGDGVVQEIF